MTDISTYIIEFERMEWQQIATGLAQKEVSRANKRIRLLEFSSGFREEDWCQKSHIGYIIKGSMTVNFNGRPQVFKKGDSLWIDQGKMHKHKVEMAENEVAVLFLVEDI